MPKAKQIATGDITTREIETPKNIPPRVKALREDLQARKSALEADGWEFEFDRETEKWTGAKPGAVGGQNFKELEKLLGFIEKRLEINPAETASEVSEINVGDLIPSSFEPQLVRRKKFTNEELTELSNSIKKQGLISRITVRPAKEETGKYEIICGERRYMASMIAGKTSILSVVRFDLTDAAALEIQFQENLQRKDIDPLDEAYSYQYLLDHTQMTITDLAIKFGKPEKFIAQRLKLNLLVAEVLEDVAAGFLPLGHALEISKIAPEVQKQALTYCYDTSWTDQGYVPVKTKIKTLGDFRSRIQREIFLSLKEANFSTKATNLRDDGLPCVKCPERTGAKNSLFEDLHESKNDRCLNLVCFTGKSVRAFIMTRDELSAEVIAEGKFAPDYKIPIISWRSSEADSIEKKFGERPLVDGEYRNLWNSECEFQETAIFADDNRFGEKINICRSTDCPKHGKSLKQNQNETSGAPGEKTPAEKEAFYKRKQEIFDVKIGEAVRLKVLAEATQYFSAGRWIFDDEKWRILLLARLWSGVDDNARKAIHEAMGKEKWSIKTFGSHDSEKTILEYFSTKLTADERSKMLFLCIVANEGEMLYGTWNSQDRIIAVAEEFGVDYKKLDASERLTKSPKKYFSQAQDYFNAVERGEKPERPVFYQADK